MGTDDLADARGLAPLFRRHPRQVQRYLAKWEERRKGGDLTCPEVVRDPVGEGRPPLRARVSDVRRHLDLDD